MQAELTRAESLGLRPHQVNILMVHEDGHNDIGQVWGLHRDKLVKDLGISSRRIDVINRLENADIALERRGPSAVHVVFLHLSSTRDSSEYDAKARAAIEGLSIRPLVITYDTSESGDNRPLFRDDLVDLKWDIWADKRWDGPGNLIRSRMGWLAPAPEAAPGWTP